MKGKAAKGDHLVEKYAVTPDVRHRGEQTIGEALWRHPAYWEQPLALLLVIIVLINISRQTEISNLDLPLLQVQRGDETVPGGDISVDEVKLLQVLAAPGHVQTHEDEVSHPDAVHAGHGAGSVGPEVGEQVPALQHNLIFCKETKKMIEAKIGVLSTKQQKLN